MLRCLSVLDLPELAAIENAIQPYPWSKETFERCFQADARGWGIEVASSIAGFILVLTQTAECHILNLGVVAAYQHQGYGQQLLKQGLEEAAQEGAKMAYLEVRSSNHKAISLYTKLGFKKIGERKNYYPGPERKEDAWIWVKELTS
ncbi:MAG: mshD 1 [Gammaproteobacteria bacterium]|nr:mshD 1 [Gammaproteobacteria bacterium]